MYFDQDKSNDFKKVLKTFGWFIISNSIFFISLYVVYKNTYNVVFIYTGLLFGLFLMNFISYLLHFIALKVCKRTVLEFQHSSFQPTTVEIIAFCLYFILLIVTTILFFYKDKLPNVENFLLITFGISLIYLSIATLFISISISNELPSKGIIGKLVSNTLFVNYEFFLSKKMKGSVECFDTYSGRFKGATVRKMNYINLIFSGVISICYVYFSPNFLDYFPNNNFNCSYLIFLVISFPIVTRTIARSFEIICAFFKDTIDGNKKTTDIQSHERVILAIYSLIEITLLFSAVYLFIEIMSLISNGSTVLDNMYFLFYSFGISTYKSIDFALLSKTQSLAVVLQVVTSMVLIVFTFARYIGEIKENKNNFNNAQFATPRKKDT